MSLPYEPRRPGILTLVMVVSFLWSALRVLLVIAGVFFAAILGGASWIFGPLVGAVGTAISFGAIVLLILQSLLSLLLFAAAWHTWAGDPSGRSLHRTWAFINIIIDGAALLFTSGLSPSAWWGFVYALCILYVMSLPEVLAYFNRQAFGSPYKPGGFIDDQL